MQATWDHVNTTWINLGIGRLTSNQHVGAGSESSGITKQVAYHGRQIFRDA